MKRQQPLLEIPVVTEEFYTAADADLEHHVEPQSAPDYLQISRELDIRVQAIHTLVS
jgi:hypothetical protein